MRTKRYLKYILLLCTIVSVLVLYEISVNYMQKSEQEETKKLVHTTTEEKNVLEIYSEEAYLRFTQSVLENDDEIWDYVMQQGIWKVTGVDIVKSNNERKK